jgi:hypothetical protein
MLSRITREHIDAKNKIYAAKAWREFQQQWNVEKVIKEKELLKLRKEIESI